MKNTMKFTALVALFLALSVVTNLVMNGSTAAGPPDCVPGDIDGDGSVQLNDAVALLNFLFVQGDPPVACAQPPQLTADEVALLQEILPHLSVEFLDDEQGGTNKTVRFTGVNVQIVNGLEATNGNPGDPLVPTGDTAVNGLGNLIVGYNEVASNPQQVLHRTGSHNVVLGTCNQYGGFGGVIGGFFNSSDGSWCSILSGSQNSMSNQATSSVVVAGVLNTMEAPCGDGTVIVGGQQNTACGPTSVVVGGNENTTLGPFGVVVGGTTNTVVTTGGVVLGGGGNSTSSLYAVVVGGANNTASGESSVVSGGSSRTASGTHDWVAGSLFEDF